MCLLDLDRVLSVFHAQFWQCYLCNSPKKNSPELQNVKQHTTNPPTKCSVASQAYSQHSRPSCLSHLKTKTASFTSQAFRKESEKEWDEGTCCAAASSFRLWVCMCVHVCVFPTTKLTQTEKTELSFLHIGTTTKTTENMNIGDAEAGTRVDVQPHYQ